VSKTLILSKKEIQSFLHDIAVAGYVYEEAKRKKLGKYIKI